MDVNRLKEIYDSFKDKKIAVVGDLMLDTYVWGKVSRISQEAPVQVVQIQKKTYTPGGAANVMRNIIALGGKVSGYGIIGNDENGKLLKSLLTENSINHNSVYVDSTRQTTEKKRVISSSQQLIRIDYEDLHPVSDDLKKQLIDDLKREIQERKIDGIIFEDYAKGLLDKTMVQQIAAMALENRIFMALDPHPSQSLDVKGLNLITPNRNEAFQLAGIYGYTPTQPVEKDKSLKKVAAKLQEKWDCAHLLITLGAQGMALFNSKNEFTVIPTITQEVFDVSGAGDTVISAFSLSLLGNATPLEAAEIANHAAGVVVGKVGTVSVSIEDLYNSFDAHE